MSELTKEERDWLEKYGSSMHDVGACIDWIIKFRRELAIKDKEIEELKKDNKYFRTTLKEFVEWLYEQSEGDEICPGCAGVIVDKLNDLDLN